MKKITNYKSQITNKFQIRNYKLQTLLWKRNTDYPNGAKCKEAWYNDCPHMKSFVGVQGAVFQKSPLAAGGKKNGPIGKSTDGYSGFLQPVVS
jgi:hypothetical protein